MAKCHPKTHSWKLDINSLVNSDNPQVSGKVVPGHWKKVLWKWERKTVLQGTMWVPDKAVWTEWEGVGEVR